MARPTKHTGPTEAQLLRLLADGVPRVHACEAVGIAFETFRTWMHEKPAFSDAVKRAEARSISVRVRRISAAARNGAWQADAWWLERRYPAVFGRRDAVDVTMRNQVYADAERVAMQLGVPVEQVLRESGIAAMLPGPAEDI